MIWVNIIAVIILIFSLLGGLKEGAVKHFFNLIILIVAIPLAGLSYRLIAAILSFLPGTNWENFIGFFIALAIISGLLHFRYLLPRKITKKGARWCPEYCQRRRGHGGIYTGGWSLSCFRMAGTGFDQFQRPSVAGGALEFCSGNAA